MPGQGGSQNYEEFTEKYFNSMFISIQTQSWHVTWVLYVYTDIPCYPYGLVPRLHGYKSGFAYSLYPPFHIFKSSLDYL